MMRFPLTLKALRSVLPVTEYQGQLYAGVLPYSTRVSTAELEVFFPSNLLMDCLEIRIVNELVTFVLDTVFQCIFGPSFIVILLGLYNVYFCPVLVLNFRY
jgi:hypothetical protein